MGIYGMIRRKMSKFTEMANERADKKFLRRTEQLEKLEKQKLELEKREFARKALAERKKEVRALKTAKFREAVGAIKQAGSKLKSSSTGIRSNLGKSSGSTGVFATGGRNVFGPEPKKKVSSRRRGVTIYVK